MGRKSGIENWDKNKNGNTKIARVTNGASHYYNRKRFTTITTTTMTVSIVVGGGGGGGAWRSGRNTPLQLSVGGLEGGIFRARVVLSTHA